MASPKRRWHDQHVLALAENQGVADPELAVKSLCGALIDEANVTTPPKPEVLASLRGVLRVRRVPMKEAGRLVPLDQGFEIQVNAGHSLERQNFSIDHEVCHTFFAEYGERRSIVDNDTGTFNVKAEEEFLCDVGAAALLFVPRWFRPMASDIGPSGAAISQLAQSFGGSLEATARAWCDLNLWACAVLFWEKSIKPSQNGLLYQQPFPGLEAVKDDLFVPRIRLGWHSTSFKALRYFPKYKSAGKGGLVYACFDSGQDTSGVENFEFESGMSHLWTDNFYVPYRKDGALRPRVMSVVTLARKPQAVR